VLHGGDLADGGAGSLEVVDHIRGLGWRGVLGNGDDALARPESLDAFAAQSKAPASLWVAIRDMMAAVRDRLGPDRVAWLGTFPMMQTEGPVALVHASPGDTWRVDEAALLTRDAPLAVFGHTHVPFVRDRVANSGSVGLPYDGDPRACYLLIDDGVPFIRRVAYDIERESRRLADSHFPHAGWIARVLRTASPQ
jgi:diadenosine tetraphosphatase ApaH/serine/threonine PP2A family protein phosphatase